MEIENNKLYFNRAWKYLYPALRVYNAELIKQLNGLIKLGVGIGDYNYCKKDVCKEPKLFILVQTGFDEKTDFKGLTDYEKKVKEFFKFIKEQDYYVDDYLYSYSSDTTKHMIVIKFPEEFKKVYKHFVSGEFSKMYDADFIKKNFVVGSYKPKFNTSSYNKANSIGENLEVKKVLLKDKSYEKEFTEILKKEFGTIPDSEYIEYDFGVNLLEEIFSFENQ